MDPDIANALIDFEIKISVTDGKVSASQIFVVHVARPAPSPTTSTISVSSASVASAGSVTVTLQGKDLTNTAVTYGGATVTFATSGGTSSGAFSATTDNGNGTILQPSLV